MNPDHLCMGCMNDCGTEEQCPHCGRLKGTSAGSPLYLPPRTVLKGQYLIGRVLDYGGFGILYLGWDLHLARKLAIKEYMPSGVATRAGESLEVTVFSGSPGEFDYGLEQFLEEGRVLARFQGHPNIVDVLNFFREHQTAYLVMEYLDGVSLEGYLKHHDEKIPIEKALQILLPCMDALRQVHAQGLLHRDISPDNVFVLNDGTVKLIDFGAARYALGQRSRNLSVILKEGYAPPEQYTSTGNQGPWTDVYGMAATLYRSITGEVPAPSLERYETDLLVAPSKKGIPIEKRVEKALLKGLQTRATKRCQSIEDFQSAISRQSSKPPTAGTPQWIVKLAAGWKSVLAWCRGRTPQLVAALSATLLVAKNAGRRLGPVLRQSGRLSQMALKQLGALFKKLLVLGGNRPEARWLAAAAMLAVAIIVLALLFRPDGTPSNDGQKADGSTTQDSDPPKTDDKDGNESDSRGDLPPAEEEVVKAEVPMIAQLQPSSSPVVSDDLNLVVHGRKFQEDAVVVWNNHVVLPTRYLDPNRLQARVPSQQLSRPGTAKVKVYNPIDGLRRGLNSAQMDFSIIDRPTGGGDRYAELMRLAAAASRNRDAQSAMGYARQAIQVDSNRAQAYDLLAFEYVYSLTDFPKAASHYRAAIERGGPASFRLRHDHSGLTFSSSCTGFLRIFPSRVRFQGEGGHAFETSRRAIREAKMNRSSRFLNPFTGVKDAFHIKISRGNFNFLGTSRLPKQEADLLLSLLNSSARTTRK